MTFLIGFYFGGLLSALMLSMIGEIVAPHLNIEVDRAATIDIVIRVVTWPVSIPYYLWSVYRGS